MTPYLFEGMIMSCPTETQLDDIADNLVTRGYVITQDFLPHHLLVSLLAEFEQLQTNSFKAAGIGRQTDFQLRETIRSDKIHWIDAVTPTTIDFLQWMESLRVGLNQRLLMGLFDFESHFAHYPVGAFYKKHLDAFASHKLQGANRVLSIVLYLNRDWHVDNGGELLIYTEQDTHVVEKILPVFGRMVIFLSEKFPHEVLPANRERKSIAGWFRVNEGVLK